MNNNKYARQLHATYNDIQYIMGRNDKNLSSFNAYTGILTRQLEREKQDFLQKIGFKNNQKRAIEIEKLINGKKIMFSEEEIANAAVKKIGESYGDKKNAKVALENVYKQLEQGFSNWGNTLSYLEDFLKVQQGLIPSGSSISFDEKFLNQLKSKLSEAESYKDGKLSNLLGDLGETTSFMAETAITNALIDSLADQLQVSSSGIKATAVVENKGNEKFNGETVQTDNKLSISFNFSDDIVAQFSDLKNGLSLSINISDKANKKLSKLSGNRRTTTNALTFRSSKVSTLMNEMPKKIQSATYNLISYHRQGKELVGFMSAAPGFALRKYLGYKLLQKMFLSEGNLNQINFTVYGTSIYAEQEVYDKLYRSGNIMADVEYWTLKSLVGQFRGKTIEEGLKQGTAEANKRIENMKVAIRASLKLK